jgi:hypothetical protein
MTFQSLDANANGNISQDEWRWSESSFESLDTNRDGVLNNREYRGGAVGTSGF